MGIKIEKEFEEEYKKTMMNFPSGSFSKRFTEQLCYKFYLLGRKKTKSKKILGKESLGIIKKL